MKNCIECNKELTGQQVKFCSNACKQKNHYKRVQLQQNTYYSQTKRGYLRKALFVRLLGGCCSKCGYNANYAALEFHHVTNKSFALDIRRLSNSRIELLYEELKKCVLLCSNCHREHHNTELEEKTLINALGDSLEKSKDANWVNSVESKSIDMTIPSQAIGKLIEGVETSGEI